MKIQIHKKIIVFLLVILALFFLTGVIAEEPEGGTIIDEFECPYGWNGTHFNQDCVSYEPTQVGAVRIWEGGLLRGAVGFALSGTVNGESYFADTTDFTPWVWWLEDDGDNKYTLIGYNNYAPFAWKQNWQFAPDENVKITHELVNNLTDVEDFTVWYIHTLQENQTLIYNNTFYQVSFDETVYLNGNFNDILPQVEFEGAYIFDYSDLIEEGYVITDILIGNASFLGAPDILVMAVGVTDADGELLKGETMTLDPLIESSAEHSATEQTSAENIILDSNTKCHATWEHSDDLIYYGNDSTCDNSWTIKQLLTTLAGTYSLAGITVDSADNLFIYSKHSSLYFPKVHKFVGWNSTNGGVSFSSEPYTIAAISGYPIMKEMSCVVNESDAIGCCYVGMYGVPANDGSLRFVESGSWGGAGVKINTNSSRVSDYCDIETDSDNWYVVDSSNSVKGDDIHIWSSADWGNTGDFVVEANNSGTGYGVSIRVWFDNIFIASINDSQLVFTYGKTSDLTSWTSVVVDADPSYFPDVVTNGKIVKINYMNRTSLGVNTRQFYAIANLSDLTSWDARNEIDSKITYGFGFGTDADTNYPTQNNRAETNTGTSYQVHSRTDGLGGESVIFNKTVISNYSCDYAEGIMWDWEIEERCIKGDETVNVCPYGVVVKDSGSLTLTGITEINASSVVGFGDLKIKLTDPELGLGMC